MYDSLDDIDIDIESDIEDEVTRVFQREPTRLALPRGARARARGLMVGTLFVLVALGDRGGVTVPTAKAAMLTLSSDAEDARSLRTLAPVVTVPDQAYRPARSANVTLLGLDLDTTGLPLKAVPSGGISLGEPHRGRLRGGVQLPKNPSLYLVRRPEFAFGSTHAVMNLQLGLAKFRDYSGYPGPLIVSDLSAQRGGRHFPHKSHQSGRDVDVWLPLRSYSDGITVKGGSPETDSIDFEHFSAKHPGEIDWDASWQLVRALLRTGQVERIFLDRSRHRFLHEAALRNGLSEQDADTLIEGVKSKTVNAVVHHVAGHDKHIHVRFRCADDEQRCRS
jgi:murein endopeptidase